MTNKIICFLCKKFSEIFLLSDVICLGFIIIINTFLMYIIYLFFLPFSYVYRALYGLVNYLDEFGKIKVEELQNIYKMIKEINK